LIVFVGVISPRTPFNTALRRLTGNF
jgi:hypothetical protein